MLRRPHIVAFDIIGTVFSLEPLRQRLVGLGLAPGALELWFAASLRDAFALAASDSFQPFKSVLESTLDGLLAQNRIAAAGEQKQQALGAILELPAHADAKEAFETLKSSGIRIIAVSNGAASTTKTLLERAGLLSFVENIISVDEVQASKPRKDVYLQAARTAGVATHELTLVATHAWDIHGAKRAGLTAGFVARGQRFPNIFSQPDVTGESLYDVAAQLAAAT